MHGDYHDPDDDIEDWDYWASNFDFARVFTCPHCGRDLDDDASRLCPTCRQVAAGDA